MFDMLVNLMHLPDFFQDEKRLEERHIRVFRGIGPDRIRIVNWVREHDGESAASECDCSFSRNVPTCYVAVCENKIIGFACYDATAPDFFGPTMVQNEYRGMGVGKILLLRSLYSMREKGYVYAVIGGVGPAEFYKKCVGAVRIDNSTPGIYENFLGLSSGGAETNNKQQMERTIK